MEPDVDTKVLAEAPDGAAATALADNRNGSQQLGRYELIQRLGHGGMATVYLARTRGLGGFQKLVAVKVIHPHLAEEQPFVRMFLDEARIAASLQNPHVGEVLDIGSADGVYYMVMEYIEGETLSSLRRVLQAQGQKLAPAIVLQILADACYGLHAVHELTSPDGEPLGLVHRDVSPQNLLMTLEGWVKLVDFGIAKAAGSESSTLTGCLRGKLPYMPPEQARGEVLSRATDLFSLGVIAWELLAGRRLFSGANEAETLQKVLACEVPSLAELRPELPPELVALVHRILAKSPDQRHSNAFELRHELLAVLRKRYPASRPRLALVDVMQRHFGERYAYRRASVRRTSKHPAIRVVDDGPGIDPSEQTSTTPRAYRGLALVPSNPPASESQSQSQSQVSLALEDVHTQTSTTSGALGQWPLWLGLPLVGAGIAGLAFFLGGFGSLKPAAPTSPPPVRSSPASELPPEQVPEQVAEA
ncbi:MAG: serine/threonine protein kinase, partial [Nannocystaceae bacterium]